jgi:hypothetical protein
VQQEFAERSGFDQEIERQNQDGQQPDDAADDADDGRQHAASESLAATSSGCPFDRLLQRQMFAEQPARDQKLLRALEHLVFRAP